MAKFEMKFQDALQRLSESTEDFWASRNIKVLENPTPLQFYKEAVSSYTPVIIRGMMRDWMATQSWNLAYIQDKISNKDVKVNFTINGDADSVVCDPDGGYFVFPHEETLPFSTFADMMDNPLPGDAVPYLSEQNSNFLKQFSELGEDVPLKLSLAEEAFGPAEVEAINLWIGDERSVSSVHKDHFENFYAVVSGQKIFTLLPPTDIAFLPEKDYPAKQYVKRTNKEMLNSTELFHHRIQKVDLEILPVETAAPETSSGSEETETTLTTTKLNSLPTEVRWIPIDPEDVEAATNSHPPFRFAHPVDCIVEAGEILYLPAMWYHRVTQTCLTIAVNYWYEQRFDFRFVFYQMVRSLKEDGEIEEQEDNAIV